VYWATNDEKLNRREARRNRRTEMAMKKKKNTKKSGAKGMREGAVG
jgi:hypothetical protein